MNELIEKYKQFFPKKFYIECGDGWYDLLDRMMSTIQSHQEHIEQIKKLYPERTVEYTPLEFLQIKEKFGYLRVYASGGDTYIRGIIDMTENMSGRICEFSGDKGKIRYERIDTETGKTFPAWVKCMSDTVAQKEGYL